MKKMLLMRGAPGSGKTTAIAEDGLSQYVVSMDAIRSTFAPSVPTTTGMSYALHHTIQRKVAEFSYSAVTYLAQMGQTIIIDALNLRIRDQNKYADIAKQYGYDIYLWDAQGDISDADLLARNANRPGVDQIEESVIIAKAAEGRKRWLADGVTEVASVAEFAKELTYPVMNFDRYEKVVIVGDVQSCADQLLAAVDDIGGFGHSDTAWVFAGDLYDRGPNPVGVHHLMAGAGDHVYLVDGNHDAHMRRLISDNDAPGPTRQTREMLNKAGISDHKIMSVVSRAVPMLAFTYRGEEYLVTHGGVRPSDALTVIVDIDGKPRLRPDVPDWSFMFGQSDQSHTYARTTDYTMDTSGLDDGWMVQFYGHRSGGFDAALCEAKVTDRLYALESRVETGGHLTVAVINDGEIDIRTYGEREESSLASQIRANPNIRAKDIGDGITAYNFTREAFSKGRWDKNTLAARGLFLRGDEVVARGYEKFFNAGERPGPSKHEYIANASYPVTVARKENGFLALISSVDGELVCYTKAGPTNFADEARAMLERMTDAEWLRGMVETLNVTAAIEVIHPRDPHIVNYYGRERLFLLDLIENQAKFSALPDEVADAVARRAGLERPDRRLVENSDDLWGWATAASLAKHEGYVFKDSAGAMVKIKSDYYAWAKQTRGAIERVLSGKQSREEAGIADLKFTADLEESKVETLMGSGVDVTRVLNYSTFVAASRKDTYVP